MGKKNNSGSQLGRAIIKDRFGGGRGRQRRGDPTSVRKLCSYFPTYRRFNNEFFF